MTDLPKNFGGIPGYVLDTLIASGFDTVEKLKAASDDELTALDGIGAGRVKLIRKAVAEIDEYVDAVTDAKKEFKWVSGWNWQKGEDGHAYFNFADGTEIKSLRMKRGSNELAVLVSRPE